MNEYKVIVQWRDGERLAYFYSSGSIQGAIARCSLEFPNTEVVAVTKKEC